MKKFLVGFAIMVVLFGYISTVGATQVAINIIDGAYGNAASINTGADYVFGWSFSTNSDILITDFGFYDYADPIYSTQDGLAFDHDIGIWTNAGVLLDSAVISAGTVDPLLDSFRYTSVSPLLLKSGNTFMITTVNPRGANDGITPQDPLFISATPGTGFVWDENINFIDSWMDPSSTLIFPTYPTGVNKFFGANFLFEPAPSPIPEPATMLLFGTGIVGLAGTRFRRKKQ